jgi:D-beta-D-heptose 7-phosphate kinase/D-beta-D-heptose 1-phosphate adenosyltransferase
MERVLEAFEAAVGDCDMVCLEDYNKGVCSEHLCQRVIEICRRAGKPVFVDPAKLSDYRRYSGATVMTPNRTEAEFATARVAEGEPSHDHNVAIAKSLLDSLHLEAVVLTLDRHGALLYGCDGTVEAIPTVARKVYDVTGAGDMFLAGLAAARANSLPWSDAVRFANAAAGLEVEVFGVAPIPFERVHHSIMLQSQHGAGKLRTRAELLLEVEAQRKSGRRIIFTNGCFDILHAGHVSLLTRAAVLEGDRGFLVVGLNDDASVRRLKGPTRPVNGEMDRARVLGALEAVGAVTLFAEDTPEALIGALKPDVLVKGADYTRDKVVGHEIVEAYGGRVELVDLVAGRSTTEVLRRAAGQSQ